MKVSSLTGNYAFRVWTPLIPGGPGICFFRDIYVEYFELNNHGKPTSCTGYWRPTAFRLSQANRRDLNKNVSIF